MPPNMLILGTGAIGSCIGADLTRAGHDVLLVDQWPAHVVAMQASGIKMITAAAEESTPVRAVFRVYLIL